MVLGKGNKGMAELFIDGKGKIDDDRELVVSLIT